MLPLYTLALGIGLSVLKNDPANDYYCTVPKYSAIMIYIP